MKIIENRYFFLFICLISIILKLQISKLGHNFDFESQTIIVKSISEGFNPWDTDRYNYGPIYAWILYFFYYFSGDDWLLFRELNIIFLSFIDIFISLILWKINKKYISLVFLLNPISLIISGYHNQFDNLAILPIIIIFFLTFKNKISKLNIIFLLSLSIATKHIFVFLPFFLIYYFYKNKFNIFTLLLPYLIFMLSFVPYLIPFIHNSPLNKTSEKIINNVFFYSSTGNTPLLSLLFNSDAPSRIISFITFIFGLLIFGVLIQKLNFIDLFLIYTLVLLIFSPSLANQYLVIPLIAVLYYRSIFSYLYIIYSTLFLMHDENGLGIDFGKTINYMFELTDYKFVPVLLIPILVKAIYENRNSLLFSKKLPA
jgi:hypothetical protein